jgi:hypothetical protein
MALVLMAGCGDSGGSLTIEVDRAACSPGCTVVRYELYLLEDGASGTCIFREATVDGAAPEAEVFEGLDLAEGDTFGLGVLAYCEGDPCVRCAGTSQGTVGDGAALTVTLTGAARCDVVPGSACQPRRLWLEARSGTLAGKMKIDTTSTHAKGALTGEPVYPDLDQFNHVGTITDADSATYSVDLPTAGIWHLWGRLLYPGSTPHPQNDPNSFWVTVDRGERLVFGNRIDRDGQWHWDGNDGGRLTLGPLSAGQREVKVFNREARETATEKLSPRLDLLLLTNDPGFRPTDAVARQELGL